MKFRWSLIVVACLLSVTCAALLYGAAKEADATREALELQLQDALRSRAESAQSAFDAIEASYLAETVTYSDLAEATVKLAEAELALATKPKEKVVAWERHVERAKKQETMLKELFEAGGRGGEASVYYPAKRERESAEISLLKARLKAIK